MYTSTSPLDLAPDSESASRSSSPAKRVRLDTTTPAPGVAHVTPQDDPRDGNADGPCVVITRETLQDVSFSIDRFVQLVAEDAHENADANVLRERLLDDLGWVGLPEARDADHVDQHVAARTVSAVVALPMAQSAERGALRFLQDALSTVTVRTVEPLRSILSRIADKESPLPTRMTACDLAGEELFPVGSGETIQDLVQLMANNVPFTSEYQRSWVDGVTRAIAVMVATKSSLCRPAVLDLSL
jgi:hypothetical protein